MTQTMAFVGFGEVGSTFAQAFLIAGIELRAFDLQFDDKFSAPISSCSNLKIEASASAGQAVLDANIIISAVTAGQTCAAARSVSNGMSDGAWYLDVNSASPNAKIKAAKMINQSGGRYIEASIMSPVNPNGILSPILVGGPHAREFLPVAQKIGLTNTKLYSETPGKTAAAKLCRSVMIKGLEALITESLLCARYYGVEDEVLTSLSNLVPHPDWESHAKYMISRSVLHGTRRAEEMFEAAAMVNNAGLVPLMSNACANRQNEMADFSSAANETDLRKLLDKIISMNNRKNLS